MSDVIKPALKLGREMLKAGMASAFTGTGLIDLITHLRTVTAGPRIHVLGYHRVVDRIDFDGPVNPSLCITTDSFRKQMQQVRDRFEVLPLADALRAVDGQHYLERDAVAITFDDGYHDVYARAMPILRELDLPATVFVPTGYVLGGTLPHDRLYAALWKARRDQIDLTEAPVPVPLRAWVEKMVAAAHDEGLAAGVELLIAWLPSPALHQIADACEQLLGAAPALDRGASVMTPAEIHALSEAGWEIGAHTIEHAVLTHEPDDRVQDQLVRPRIDLERFTGKPCRFFAYCNGFHSAKLVQAVRAAGYQGAVTTCDKPNRPGGDVYRVHRKCLWDAHTRGPDGQFSAAISAAHLHDLFGDLGMTRPVDGAVPDDREVLSCAP